MTLLDQEIAHITHAVRSSVGRDAAASILPAGYWRQRLYRLLDSGHVTKAQFCAIDALLLELDTCEAQSHEQRQDSRGDT
ncbi:hypothetical protein [Paraburkholderia mimosarum]|uniref:hypothetical protein n=1 Tax=Paraburkholderia mimosarum TaxID=312026 RepID=UPI00040910D5|nr:hypothetical protein [Paraburkholderia mimosarum]